jgi:hypothetical protein
MKMTKKDLMKEFNELQEEKKCRIEGIYWNSNKSSIQNAINCLKCSDEMLEKYLIVVSLKYENIGKTIKNNGDFKHHPHNRLYVFNTARTILAD